MFRYLITAFVITIAMIFVSPISVNEDEPIRFDQMESTVTFAEPVEREFTPPDIVLVPDVLPAPITSEEKSEEMDILSQEEIELIALVTMAEAEAEPVEGQRLVIDTILNRVDSPYFPNTVYDVVYQPHQFTSMTNGRVDRCYIREDLVALVREELDNRYNSEVVFFRTTRYSDYGTPMFQVGDHYFSKYN